MRTLREKLADAQHAIWAHWMKYMFSVGKFLADGTWLMPADKVERWQRQMNTPYVDLTEQEQVSDLRQADKVIAAMKPSRLEKAKAIHLQHYAALKASGMMLQSDERQLCHALKHMLVA